MFKSGDIVAAQGNKGIWEVIDEGNLMWNTIHYRCFLIEQTHETWNNGLCQSVSQVGNKLSWVYFDEKQLELYRERSSEPINYVTLEE